MGKMSKFEEMTNLERVEARFQRIVDTVDDFCDPYKAPEQLREILYVIKHMAQRDVLMIRGMIKDGEKQKMSGNGETALPRYISPDKLIDIINPKGVGDPLVRLQDIMRAIVMTPTEDVTPIVHAHWKQVSEKYPRYVCTACNHLFNNKGFKYCPFCGAKMDEE